MLFRKLKKALVILGFLALSYSATSQATIFVPDYGSTGIQNFSYTFTDNFFGQLIFGVSNEGDTSAASTFNVVGGSITLNTQNNPVPTNIYLNASSQPGTTGELYTTPYFQFQGATISFQWIFSTNDYEPNHDFAFIKLKDINQGDVYYSVLAQVGSPVPVPSALWLFGSAVIGFFGLSRPKKLA